MRTANVISYFLLCRGGAVPAVGCGHAFGCRRGPGLHTEGDRCAAVGCECLLCVWGGAGLVTVCQTLVLFGHGTQTWAVACAQACLNREIAAPIHASQSLPGDP